MLNYQRVPKTSKAFGPNSCWSPHRWLITMSAIPRMPWARNGAQKRAKPRRTKETHHGPNFGNKTQLFITCFGSKTLNKISCSKLTRKSAQYPLVYPEYPRYTAVLIDYLFMYLCWFIQKVSPHWWLYHWSFTDPLSCTPMFWWLNQMMSSPNAIHLPSQGHQCAFCRIAASSCFSWSFRRSWLTKSARMP